MMPTRLLAACLCLLSAVEAKEPLIVAHRGLLRHAPENTLSNFRACLELRLGFEFDIEQTKDGKLICLHDNTVDRTTDGTGRVSELTLEQIRQLDAGSWFDAHFAGERIPTVEEVLKLIAEHPEHQILIAVDLKAADVGQEVVRLAEESKVLPRLLFIGRTISEPAVRAQIRQASDKAHTAAVANHPGEFSQALADDNADWVYFRFLPTPDHIQAVRAARKQAFIAGTPLVGGHHPENWQHARDVGIDAILTDYPLDMRSLFKQASAAPQ